MRHQRNNEDFPKVEDFCNEIENLVSKSKKELYQNINRKPKDPSKSVKIAVQRENVFNGNEAPTITPLHFNSSFVTDFWEKAIISIFCSANQYALFSDNIVF